MNIISKMCPSDFFFSSDFVTTNEWGQFVDIENMCELRPAKQNRFRSLVKYCLYHNSTNPANASNAKYYTENIKKPDLDTPVTAKQMVIEDPAESEYDEDLYDSNDSESETDSETDESEDDDYDQQTSLPDSTKPEVIVIPLRKNNTTSSLMKKIYRTVHLPKRRNTAILPDAFSNVDVTTTKSKVATCCSAEESDTNMIFSAQIEEKQKCRDPISCMKVFQAKSSSLCEFCAAQQATIRVSPGNKDISLSIPEAVAVLIALHPKAAQCSATAEKLKMQYEQSSLEKQTQIISKINLEKLESMLTRLRVNTPRSQQACVN